MAIHLLRQKGYPVVSIGLREGQVKDVPIITYHPLMNDIHTVTIYLNIVAQQSFYDYILLLSPKRVIFNPETENHILKKKLQAHGIEVVENCTLVMLNKNLF